MAKVADEEYAAVEEGDDVARVTWDLYTDGSPTKPGKPVETVDELLAVAYDGYPKNTLEERQQVLRQFMTLTIAKAMPADLRAAVKEYLA